MPFKLVQSQWFYNGCLRDFFENYGNLVVCVFISCSLLYSAYGIHIVRLCFSFIIITLNAVQMIRSLQQANHKMNTNIYDDCVLNPGQRDRESHTPTPQRHVVSVNCRKHGTPISLWAKSHTDRRQTSITKEQIDIFRERALLIWS